MQKDDNARAQQIGQTTSASEDTQKETPTPPRPAQSFKFMSNFKEIIDSMEKFTPKQVIASLSSRTKVSNRLMTGFYTGKFTPTIKEACYIAQQLGVNVEAVWYLLPDTKIEG